jgi:uncharacterized protein (DUF1778 family)
MVKLVAPIQVKLTPAERRAWRAAARRRRVTVADFVRNVVRAQLAHVDAEVPETATCAPRS